MMKRIAITVALLIMLMADAALADNYIGYVADVMLVEDTPLYVFLDPTDYQKGSYNFKLFTMTEEALQKLPLSVRWDLTSKKYSIGDIFAATISYNGTPYDNSDDYITDMIWHKHYDWNK